MGNPTTYPQFEKVADQLLDDVDNDWNELGFGCIPEHALLDMLIEDEYIDGPSNPALREFARKYVRYNYHPNGRLRYHPSVMRPSAKRKF